jgi:sulfite reductase (NADPH) flavoprotein alpha-component
MSWTRANPRQATVLVLLALAAVAMLPLHDDPWWVAAPRPERWLGAAAVVLAFLAGCAWSARVAWRARERTSKSTVPASPARADRVLVAHASQTGFALELAERTAQVLRDAGVPVDVASLGRVDAARLAACPRLLAIASTTGEGDAPDPALAFVSGAMAAPVALGGLAYAVLALGDRSYGHFCGFGHAVDSWLRASGATPLFDLVEVDNGDPAALRHWQHHLGVLAGEPESPDWTPVRYEPWRLAARRELNPGSAGGPVFELAFDPPPGAPPSWQAGDIAEVGPRQAPAAVDAFLATTGLADVAATSDGGRTPSTADAGLRDLLSRSHLPEPEAVRGLDAATLAERLELLPHREYSIASIPNDGRLELLVRCMARPDGTPGIGSGWLCNHAPVGGTVDLRIRSNPNFHAPDRSRPLILVGNGTGLAGLRAHLRQRIAAGAGRNWLVFGERNAARDWFHREELEALHARGDIERLDVVFSRDGGPLRYVQDVLEVRADAVRAWVDDGAGILVSGSLQGMAPGVDAVLRGILGDALLATMRVEGRYRRDVY